MRVYRTLSVVWSVNVLYIPRGGVNIVGYPSDVSSYKVIVSVRETSV